MKRTIITVFTFTILIGVIALCLNMALGNETITYLEKVKVQYGNNAIFYYWKFDFSNYAMQIETYTTDLSILTFEMPEKQWVEITGTMLDSQWWQALGNNLAVILNYIIVGINVILYPFKIGAYLLRNILVILGINQNTSAERNGLAWLVIFVRDILSQIAIPYIE